MKILKGILSENRAYYLKVKKDIEKKISKLPKGCVKERCISGRVYFYIQKREDKKIVHKYLGKERPVEIIEQIDKRRILEKEVKKVKEALRIIDKTKVK